MRLHTPRVQLCPLRGVASVHHHTQCTPSCSTRVRNRRGSVGSGGGDGDGGGGAAAGAAAAKAAARAPAPLDCFFQP